ncbi:acyl carrier protein [Azotobacter vinelandii]
MIWCESLGSNEALDFFQQGGDSLMALRMVNRLNAELGLALTMETVFDSKTLKGLLAYIVREITKLGLQVDCLELRNALLKPPSPVQWSARRTVFPRSASAAPLC